MPAAPLNPLDEWQLEILPPALEAAVIARDDDEEDLATLFSPPPVHAPRPFNKGRRAQVMAPSVDEVSENWRAPVYTKTAEEKEALRGMLKGNMLISDMRPEDVEMVLDAFQGLRFLEGATIIQQGALGECLYILESGACDISVAGEGVVMQVTPGTSFGELALLHDAPRAATVVATLRCRCWALDRATFKRIIVSATNRRKLRYESFLDGVPILRSLGRYETLRLADALRDLST